MLRFIPPLVLLSGCFTLPGVDEAPPVDSGGVAVVADCDDGVEPTEELCDGIDNDCNGYIDDRLWSSGFRDADGDGFGEGEPVEWCRGETGYSEQGGDCDDSEPLVNPGQAEICDELDNDCDGTADNAQGGLFYADTDGDGFGDPNTTSEACGGDAWVGVAGDCDDGSDAVNPDATETCNGIDDDCDGEVDNDATDATTWYQDADGDTIGGDTSQVSCTPPSGSWSEIGGDCDDTAADIAPGNAELCDGIDNDCDGDIDESAPTWFIDSDDDGFGDPSGLTSEGCTQPAGYAPNATDCDDGDAQVNPGATEVCNGVDDDCNSQVDDDDPGTIGAPSWFRDVDGDTHGDADNSVDACGAPSGYVGSDDDCDDALGTTFPGADETCNDVDDDCNGVVDNDPVDPLTWYADTDGDGFGNSAATTEACDQPVGWLADDTDCDDNDPDQFPGATEICNLEDDDCDGTDDEGVTPPTWYADNDDDGYGDLNDTTQACTQPASTSDNADDCDDGEPLVHPGATLMCNGTDANCDGDIDNDADGDDFSDDSCGGSDCLDSDATVFPDSSNGLCALGIDCTDIKDQGRDFYGDGLYAVDADGTGGSLFPYELYCDMTTDGGGWTLVWAYTFTNYNNFGSTSNAITPRPNWGTQGGDTPVSTTIPTSPDSDYNAMPYADWTTYGTEFMVSSNLTHTYVCLPGSGSLLTRTAGTLSCRNVMNQGSVCMNRVPENLVMYAGELPYLEDNQGTSFGTAYVYDHETSGQYWPTHDRCNSNSLNHVTGLSNPNGQLWVRR